MLSIAPPGLSETSKENAESAVVCNFDEAYLDACLRCAAGGRRGVARRQRQPRWDGLAVGSPGRREPPLHPPELADQPENYPQMNGRLVFQQATKRMPEVTLEALEAHGLEVGDVDLFVNHQANKRIDDRFAEALGVPQEKVVSTIAKYGNTSAATIPLGLHEARANGRLQPGMLVCSAAFGAGFTWGAALYRW